MKPSIRPSQNLDERVDIAVSHSSFSPEDVRCWAVVPAAGIGSRMSTGIPKQYLALNNKAIIEHTLDRLSQVDQVIGIMVAIAEDDDHWPQTRLPENIDIRTVPGGAMRHHSVLNALHQLRKFIPGQDWVLVHDAARPCVHPRDIGKLITCLYSHDVGGLLGIPVADTMKRVDEAGKVLESINREGLWHALTPQMFRLETLIAAIETAQKVGSAITDEASALEFIGKQPVVIAGRHDNIKVTTSGDIELAEQFLRRQEETGL